MKNFKQVIKQEILTNLSKLDSLKDRDNPLSSPEELWAEAIANNVVDKYSPFISEVEEFNNMMGKGDSNNISPIIPKKEEWQFIVDFIKEELDEYEEACKNNDIVEVADALGDIMYVLCNGILLHGLKDKFNEIYDEIQRSNLSKLCYTEDEAKESVSVRSKEKGWDIHYEKINNHYVLYRSSDRKVQKSINFSSPNLKPIIEK
jgi:predicted HAD superfamily Cof-like phosphohydrolase